MSMWDDHEDPDCEGMCPECLDVCMRFNEQLSHATINGYLHFYTCEGCGLTEYWFQDYNTEDISILPDYIA